MKRLELLFHRTHSPARWAQWALAGLALAFAADLGIRYQALRESVERKRERIERAAPADARAPAPAGLVPVSSRPVDPEELAFARETIRRMSIPWDDLFIALELARNDKIALLSIEPDAERRTVTITAEAKDYLAALSYVGALGAQRRLAHVRLVKHETRPSEPQPPLVFTVAADWGGTPR